MSATAAPRKLTRRLWKDAWRPLLGGLVVALVMTGVAGAYWTATGAGSGSGPVGTLAAPTLSGSPGAGTATLTWTAVTPPGLGSVYYYVQRNGGNPNGNCPAQAGPPSVLTCTDSGLSAGAYSYTVTAVWQSWTAISSPATQVNLASGALDHFVLSAATTTPAAGAANNLTITAKDSAGITVTTYTGSHNLTFTGAGSIGIYIPTVTNSGGTATNFGTATAITFNNGLATVSGSNNGVMTLYKAETVSLVVSDGSGHSNGTGLSLIVGPAGLNSFTIPTPPTQTAGVPFNVSITARDAYGNTVTGYTGSQCLTFSGPANSPNGTAPSYPVQGSCGAGRSAVTFTSGVAAAVSIALYNPSTSTVLTATDAPSAKSGSTGAFTVSVGPVASFAIPTPATQTAGVQFSVSITATDAYGSTVTGYTGSKCLTFSGPANSPNGTPPTYPPQGLCAAGQSAVTFASGVAAGVAITLYNPSASTVLTASDPLLSRSGSTGAFTVSVGPVASLTITTPATQTAGVPFNVSITAKDAYGSTVTGYTGSQCLTFSGPTNSPDGTRPSYPAQGSCAAGQSAVTFTNGVAAAVPITLYNASATVLTAIDVPSGRSGSTGAFAVNAAGTARYSLTDSGGNPLGSQTAGTAFSVKLAAVDPYGNATLSYSGAKTIAWSGPGNAPNGTAPSYPSTATSVTFTSGVGTATGITLYKAETPTLQAQDSGAPTIKGTATFTVNALATSSLRLAAATTTPSAGQADSLTITALDMYGNTTTSYTGSHSLTFSGPTAIGAFTPTVTNAGGAAINFGTATAITFTNGVATVSGSNNGEMKLYRAQTVNIVVSDGSHTNGTGLPITVSAGTPGSFTIPTPTARTAGTAFNVTLTATADAYGNAPTNYTGPKCIAFSGPTASPNGTNPFYPAQGSCAAGQSAVTFTSGAATVSITLYDATSSTTLTATDAASGVHGSTGAFAVNGLTTMSIFVLTAATITPTAGQTDALTITAGDTWGNTVTSYTGAHNLTFSGASSIRTYNPTVTNNGGTAIAFRGTTAITFTNGVSSAGGVMTLYKAQTAHLVVSDGSHNNGSGLEVTVGPAALSGLSLSAEKVVVRPGAPDQLTIRAVDTYGNTATGYSNGSHNLTFAGGSGTRTVTNSAGAAINFGAATAITFTNNVSTAGGVLRITDLQTANITVSDGGPASPPLRIVVSNVSASAVSAGAFHTCALRSDGAVECWGRNDNGQLGNGSTASSSNPVMVSGLTNATQISAGKYHTCAVRSDGTVWCWGLNDVGELGSASTTDSSTPVQVRAVSGSGYLTGVSQVSANGRSTCALITASQSVFCWGDNRSGQLGIGAADNNPHTRPAAVVGVGGVGTLTGVSSITTGANHACALLSSGGVDCWGLDDHGQLGNGGAIPGTNSARPVQVVGVGGSGTLSGVSEISGGRMHVCARLGATVYCWGRNENGELGDGTTTNRSYPVRAGSINTAAQISAGEYHSCALLADGTAQCWGAAAYGQVGDGTTADTSTPVTVIGPGGFGTLTGMGNISAGGGDIGEADDFEHTCALMTDGTVVCWGQNNYGQLGDGTTTMSIFPVGVALQ